LTALHLLVGRNFLILKNIGESDKLVGRVGWSGEVGECREGSGVEGEGFEKGVMTAELECLFEVTMTWSSDKSLPLILC